MLRGSRVALHPDIPHDARKWRNHPDIWKWCRQHTLLNEGEHTRWLEKIQTDPSIRMFGIAVTEVAADWPGCGDIGVCGLTSINRVNQSAEFSLYVAMEHQGHGYGAEALQLLLRHAFMDQNLNRVWGETFDGNPAIRTFERLGMKREGTLRQSYYKDGKFIDSHIYSILREEYL